MQATRREIVDVLKKQAGGTVEELARKLELSPMCIRQHLALLERDGLVTPKEVRRRTGRPHYFYTLTDKSDDLFPKAYDKLASAIISDIKAIDGPERVVAMMSRLGERLGDEYLQLLADKPMEDRLTAILNILGDGTPMGEWHRSADDFVMHEFDCPYHRVSAEHPEVCGLHIHLMKRVLDADISREENMATGDVRCTYRIRPRYAAQAQ
ncbi:MAG: helix-turn-helix transcriptional regulator [Chloroflexota bacterium]